MRWRWRPVPRRRKPRLCCRARMVVAAFQNVSAEELQNPEVTMDGDVVVCSDHSDAKGLVTGLVRKIPELRPVDGGASGQR